ncbi:MAG: BrnA antitoxin family protein [Xanthomonadaceae bacterium]|jgi:uncharacterized protein (DUF4415 family)|nr:BrnA antitoxin family protein [Xanthomonadaceae bacterium]
MRDDYDFSEAKSVGEVPALARLQAENLAKERITIRLDADVLAWFRARVAGGGNYQTLINEVLRGHIAEREGTLERTLRRIIREELQAG